MANNSDTPAFTLENLRILEEAIASGVRRVEYSDKRIEYNAPADLLKVRQLMRNKLGLRKTGGKKGLFGGQRIVAKHSKGL